MKNDRQTKAELIEELESVRRKVKKLESLVEKRTHTRQDITERERVEAALRESEDRYRNIVELSLDPIFVHSEGKIVFVNSATLRLFGAKMPREIIGKSVLDFVHPDYREFALNRIQKIYSEGLPSTNVEEKFVRFDGTMIDVEVSSIPCTFSGRKAVQGVVRDITERRQVEEKNAEQARLLDVAQDAIVVRDIDDRLLFWNKGAENLYGWNYEEAKALDVRFLVNEDERINYEQHKREFLLKGHWEGELLQLTKERRPIVTYSRWTLVRNSEGKPVSRLIITRDITEQKQAEDKLQESEERYKALFERSLDLVYVCDFEGNFIDANEAALNLLGYKKEEIDSLNFASLLSEDQLPLAFKVTQEIKETGIQKNLVEFKLRCRNGEEVYVESKGSAIISNGITVAVQSIARNITERRQTEEKLSKSEKKYHTIFENVQDVYYETSIDGAILEISPSIEVMSKGGYRRDDLIGKSMYEFYPDANSRDTIIKAIQKTGSVTDFEIRLKNRDHSFIPCSISAKIFFSTEGRPEKIIGSMHDITERKQAEEKLLHLNQQNELILSSAAEGILGIDTQGNHTFINPAAAKMLGYEIEELLNRPSHSAWHHTKPDGSPYLKEECNIYAAYRDGKVHRSFTEVFWRKDGTSFPVEYTSTPIIEQAQLMGAVVTFSDISERKQAEGDLQETRDYLENLLSFANAPIMVWDNNNKITKFNLAFERLTKYTIYDVVGKHPEILFPVETREYLSALLSRASDGENLISIEMPVRCKDGSVRIVIWNTANIYAADDKTIIATIAHGQDITERKRAEEELNESETRYRSVLQSATDAIVTADSSGIIVGWNSGAERIFGYNYTESVGQSLTSLMPLYHQPGHTNGMERVLSGGNQHVIGKTVELEGLRKDKSVFPIELSLSTWESKSGQFFTGIIRNITERKQTEKLIQESELRFRSLYENATIGLYRTTPDGYILLANPALVKMLGYTSFEKIVERNLEKDGFESSSQRKEFLEKIERDGEVSGYESKWTRQDGSIVFVLESARAIRNSQGKTLYYDGTVENITGRKLLEEQMLQMQKLEGLGTLAGGIAHDFNNILGIILAYATTIIRMKNDPEKLERAVDTISKAVQRGSTLVRQISTFARKSDVEFELININNAAKEVVEMILETFPRTLTYSQKLQKDIPAVSADRSQIHQALLNLCVNARDAMPDGGVLTVNTNMVDGITLHHQHPDALACHYICVEVGDTGKGMTEEIRNRIFEPFFTTKEKGKGTGLGLAVVFGVVQTHKGFIDVESELRKGTTFRLYLPVPSVITPAQTEIQENVKEIPGGTETVLVVEDEETLIAFIQTSLAAKGYTVLSAADGPEAVKIYRERHKEISMVFTDLGLPGMTGMEEINIMKKINPDVKIIVATGFLDPEMKSELLIAGVKKLILKPYNFEEILKSVRDVLDEK
jgi:two-component system, cell cycle sensor histidine kinase and response regulator CckA